ncbi:MAG: 4a-hydroxytetrahydrobiopterin dehydratase [Alphaproteobacteria bacterium]|nr:4a-hydroxytetrahydrobiopterin dehydratase [Alphaproteobacteria bacterium]
MKQNWESVVTIKFDAAQRAAALKNLKGWSDHAKRDAIVKVYVFGNFVEAFGFMTQAALVAERMDHHPEWSNVYKTVTVLLTTHDAGGLTSKDIELARAMDLAAGQD